MKDQLKQAIGKLSQGSVLVVGDLAIDEMMYGTTARMSREAPVLILRHENTDIILGAAGNAVHNIARLGARRASIIAVTGKDYHCGLLLDAMQRDGVDTAGLVQDESRPTTTKTRISGIASHSVTQQIVRIDRESLEPLSPTVENQVLDRITAMAPEFDAILLSDYGLGMVTDAIIDCCKSLAEKHHLILAADSHRDLALFGGATILTPNQPEAENNVGYDLTTHEALMRGGRDLLAKTSAAHVLITRGAEGMVLFSRDNTYAEIPVFNRSEVFDVTGAGDTVVGTLTLALATGTDILTASVLGNLAASIVVKRFGASTTTPDELLAAMDKVDDRLLSGIERRSAAVTG